MAYEQTLVLAKPDAVAREIDTKIFMRYADADLKLARMRDIVMTRELATQFYIEHQGKPFFEELIEFMTSGTCRAAIFEGKEAVAKVRALNGAATDPWKALPGTIRYDFRDKYSGGPRNLVHGSDSAAAAQVEMRLIFEAPY